MKKMCESGCASGVYVCVCEGRREEEQVNRECALSFVLFVLFNGQNGFIRVYFLRALP